MTDAITRTELDPVEIAWLEYCVRTERYDRTLPGEWSRDDPDCWIPYDLGAAYRFARAEREKLRLELLRIGVSRERMESVFRWADRLPFSKQCELLEASQ